MTGLFVVATACGDAELACRDVRFEVCDIRDTGCQARVFNQMRCVRGDLTDRERPGVTLLTPDDAESVLFDDVDDDVDQDVVLAQRALSLLGMLDAAEVGDTEAQGERVIDGILGFYSSDTRKIVLIDLPDTEWGGELAVSTLGHEYVHALQDQDFGVNAYRNSHSVDFDSSLGGTSFVEGEAMLYEFLQGARIRGLEAEGFEVAPAFEASSDLLDEVAPELESPLLEAHLWFPYTYGAYGLALAWDEGRKAAVTGLRRSGLLVSLRYMAERHHTPVAEGTSQEGVGDVDGFVSLGSERLGAWLVHSFLAGTLGATTSHPQLALGWRGDRVSLLAREERDHSGVVWKIRWDSAANATQFVDLVNAKFPPVTGLWVASAQGKLSTLVAFTGDDAGFEVLATAALTDDGDPLQPRRTEPAADGGAADAGLTDAGLTEAGLTEARLAEAGGGTPEERESPSNAEAGATPAAPESSRRLSELSRAPASDPEQSLAKALQRGLRSCIR